MSPSDRNARPNRRRFRSDLLLVLACLASLTACSTIRVKVKPDDLTKEGIASTRVLRKLPVVPPNPLPAFADTGANLLKVGSRLMRKEAPRDAAAHFIKAAYDSQGLLASRKLRSDPKAEQALLKFHNNALARFAETWATDRRRLQGTVPTFVIDGHTFEVTLEETSDYAGGFFDRVIPSEAISGTGVIDSQRQGYGAALVGIREPRPEREEEMRFYPKQGLHLPITLVMGDPTEVGDAHTRVPVSIKNPMLHDRVMARGVEVPLAADFSAPLEILLNGRNQIKESLAGFFDAHKRIKSSGIILIEPYDPNRIPVILTHGLVSVPIIWRDVIAELMAVPEISRRYQFVAFTYPSSYAITESALLYRQQLAALREHYDPEGNDPLSNNVVAIGHSMGGVLTHLLVADVGNNLWNQVSDKSIDEIGWPQKTAEKVRSLAYFEPDRAVRRAVFIATPHGGATKTQKNMIQWLSTLVNLPSDLMETTRDLLSASAQEDLKIDLSKKITSIQSLSPDSPVVKGLALSPYHDAVTYHSIIGDRGKGDTPESSDGQVEYWSSHQEGAASELIVPAGHSAYTHSATVEELKRILLMHVGRRSSR